MKATNRPLASSEEEVTTSDQNEHTALLIADKVNEKLKETLKLATKTEYVQPTSCNR